MTATIQMGGETAVQRSRGLGWFSIGLGAAEAVAPGQIGSLIGIDSGARGRNTLRALGLRELATGAAILRNPRKPALTLARVGGDLIDLALLGAALSSSRTNRKRAAAAIAMVAGVAAVDAMVARQLRQRQQSPAERRRASNRVRAAVTVNCGPDEAYDFWHDFRNFPRFMQHVQAVELLDDGRSHWIANEPGGVSLEWTAEITEDRPNEVIAWRSVEGAELPNRGSVRFAPAPGDRGTEVSVEMEYDPPGGAVGSFAAKMAALFGQSPSEQIQRDLARFKQVIETGEVVKSDASIHPGLHPARPSAQPM
ncbi:MAG TPA: SRPBCC family protein [Gemmatimonadales bacterium]|nr:SRPBCC family protein [Gemmatimonadales bacterium]